MTAAGRSRRRSGGGEVRQVPDAEFSSYYGRPVVRETVWGADIPSYLFLGGLAGASSGLGAGAHLAGNRELALAAKAAAAGAISLSMVALVHDLGRPARFLNMLRVLKVTSPMSIGTWLLSGYTPLALTAAACAFTRRLPLTGAAATLGAAAIGPAVASYTAVLLSDTATPAWHGAHQELPYLFVGSAATAAGGFGMLTIPPDRARQAVRLAIAGAAAELAARHLLERRLGANAEPYHVGRPGTLMKAAEALTVAGLAGAVVAGRHRVAAAVSGAALLAASALTRFGVFEAGRVSARDPKYAVGPQRDRIRRRPGEDGAATEVH